MTAAAPPPTPTVIAQRYELQRMLAQGGMAEVWLAIDLTLDRKVAVKWLKPSLATDPVVAERFRREAIAAASLNHPNIVAVHDVFEQDGRQAVVMQLVEGKSLRQVLDTQKRLSPELTCHIGTCVAAALDHAHAAGFVHRDVKPGNIMMTSDGRVLLTDFGIAKGLSSAEADLTSDNIMMGTAKYLSPEQVRGKKLDGRADLYSLGLVLYECLAGRVPFLGETDADTALARLQRDPTDLTRLRATLPTKLVVVIHQLLARNPAQRPASGAELVDTLRDAAKEGPPPIDPTPYERSPVSPFGGRRLRRAPSDVAGRASDRARATTPPVNPSTPSSPPAAGTPPTAVRSTGSIPGEVGHTTTMAVTPVTPFSALPANHEPTPPAGTELRGRARSRTDPGMEAGVHRRRGPARRRHRSSASCCGPVSSSAAPTRGRRPGRRRGGSDGHHPRRRGAGRSPRPPARRSQRSPPTTPMVTAVENDADAVLARRRRQQRPRRGEPCATPRSTSAGKAGSVSSSRFDGPMQQALTVDLLTAPYQVAFFASDAETIPATIGDWGPELGPTQFAERHRHRHLAGTSRRRRDTCSSCSRNSALTEPAPTPIPIRGRLGEIALVG